ncbi:MAG: hypothetical protein R2733_04775 [Acidimicrobiales bacterium]
MSLSQFSNDPGSAESQHAPVPETIVGELHVHEVPTRRASNGPVGVIDYVYDFHPGRVAVRVDGPDVMAVSCDDLIDFTRAHLVSPEQVTPLERSVGMFVGRHDDQSVFRIVFDSADESKRYSTGWIQR